MHSINYSFDDRVSSIQCPGWSRMTCICQKVIGTTLGYLYSYILLLFRIVPDDTRGLLGSTILHPSLTPSQGFGVEFLMTFILTFTFFATMDPNRRNQGNDAIAQGMTMTLLHIVGVSNDRCIQLEAFGRWYHHHYHLRRRYNHHHHHHHHCCY